MVGHIRLGHPVVAAVERQVFSLEFAQSCLEHQCRLRKGGRALPDACCRYGADVDLFERDAILARQGEVAAILRPEFRDPARWFDDSQAEDDPDAPSGTIIRTAVSEPRPQGDGGCVFLQHDLRGCALHRAALSHRFAPEDIKPAVCRLYPLSFGDGVLGLSDDFHDYSCARSGGPTVYLLMRPSIRDVFGAELIRLLDRAEREVLKRRLPVAARSSL